MIERYVRNKRKVALSWEKEAYEFSHTPDFAQVVEQVKGIDFDEEKSVELYFMSDNLEDRKCFKVEADLYNQSVINIHVMTVDINEASNMMIEYWLKEQQEIE